MLVISLVWLASQPTHLLEGYGVVAWPLAFGIYFYILVRQRADNIAVGYVGMSGGAWLLAIALATAEQLWRIEQQHAWWVLGLAAAAIAGAAVRFKLNRNMAESVAEPVSAEQGEGAITEPSLATEQLQRLTGTLSCFGASSFGWSAFRR